MLIGRLTPMPRPQTVLVWSYTVRNRKSALTRMRTVRIHFRDAVGTHRSHGNRFHDLLLPRSACACSAVLRILRPHRPYYVRRCGLLLPTELHGLSVCWSVCLMVCDSSEPCKNGRRDRGAVWVEDSGWPKEPFIRWGLTSSMGRGNFEGAGRPIVKYRDNLRTSVGKTAEPIEMPFGLWARMGPRNHVLNGVHFPHGKW